LMLTMSRSIVTRSQTREQEAGPSTSTLPHPCTSNYIPEGDEPAFESFTSASRTGLHTSMPVPRHRQNHDPPLSNPMARDKGEADHTAQPRPTKTPSPNPTPRPSEGQEMPGEPGPPDEPSEGAGDSDDDDPFGSNNDDDYGYEDRGDRLFLEMTWAITKLARSNHNACQPQPLPDPLTQA